MTASTMKRIAGRAAGVAALAALCGSASAGGVTIERLATLGGTDSQGFGINDNGVVVGQAGVTGDGALHAVMWIDGVPTDLGTAYAGDSLARAVNASDQIVGWAVTGEFETDAILWDHGSITNLGDDMNAAGNTVPWDINDNGLVVGQGALGPGFSKGFVWNGPGTGVAAGTLPGYMGGANYGVNNDGVAVGSSFFFGDPDDAHLATPDGAGGYSSVQISAEGYLFAQARAINNAGVIMGHSGSPEGGPWNACIFNADHDHTIQSLGSLPEYETSEGLDINDQGVMVGWATDDDGGLIAHAWVYAGGEMIDLNSLLEPGQTEWEVLISAEEVNNHNDIVGWGRTTDGRISGFVMRGAVTPGACAGDTTGDLVVDIDDLNDILATFNTSVGAGHRFDLANNDGFVDIDDLNVVLSNWNASCE